MIDFVSTRNGTDPEIRRLAQMIASGIAIRLRDLMRSTTQEERRLQRNTNTDARGALQYFFEPGSAFEEHIELVGGSAAAFRRNLLADHPLPEGGGFTQANRAVVQLRYSWWTRQTNDQPKDHNG